MQKYIYIMMGGALGAVLRFVSEKIHIWHYSENIPLNTLIINIIGCFVLALFLTVAFELMELNADLRLGISTGFLGAFTTFSTLCGETVALLSGGEYILAISYIIISAVLGILAVYLGIVLARGLILKLLRENSDNKQQDLMGEVETE